MKYIGLVLVFLCALFVRVSEVAGAEVESGKNIVALNAAVSTSASTAVVDADAGKIAKENGRTDNTGGVQNNSVQVLPTQPPTGGTTNVYVQAQPAVAYQPANTQQSIAADAATVLDTTKLSSQKVGLIPMVGLGGYMTRWGNHIDNSYNFGLSVDIPVAPFLSVEVEGGYGRYTISYLGPSMGYNQNSMALPYSHYFNQFLMGGNLKAYLSRSMIQPYLGVGLLGVYYHNMSRGPLYSDFYDHFLGATQLLAGVDIALSDSISVGPRASWIIPTFNRPITADNGSFSSPYFEEAAAMNTSFYKLMATLKIGL